MAGSTAIDPGGAFSAGEERTPELFDVLIVGAGLSGIGAAYHLQTECPAKTFAILEARNASGGTWDLFRYPGIRSDSDMFTLGYRFRPWRESKAIADGPSILRYIRETAREYGIDRKIRYGHQVTRACVVFGRCSMDGRSDGPRTARAFDSSAIFSTCAAATTTTRKATCRAGREWNDFAAKSCILKNGPRISNMSGKRIVVIGSGATAVTLVPALADKAAHVTMLQRSPTYIVARPSQDVIANFLRKMSACARRLCHRALEECADRNVFLQSRAAKARSDEKRES